MNVEIRHPRFRSVVGDDVELETLASGFEFTEGPIWHPVDRHLIFSDVPAGRMWRWTADGGTDVFREPSNMANGNAYDAQARIITCEHATSRVTRTEPDGSVTVLASHWQGRQLNSPNDVVVGPDDGVYFTDPTYGRIEYYGVARDPELEVRAVFRVDPDGSALSMLADDFEQPNGLCFSLDGSRLFVNDTIRRHIRCFDVRDDGTVGSGPVWAETTGEGEGAPDGMKIDSKGNLYCTGPGGVHVFDPDANCLGVIRTPQYVANFAWGDSDLRGLYMTTVGSLVRARVGTPGLRAFRE